MAHIVEFAVEGLAGRKNTYSQTLNRDVNVFFGLNGSGKTSLLKILHSAMSNDVKILQNVPFQCAQVKVFSKDRQAIYTYYLEKGTKRDILSKRSVSERKKMASEHMSDAITLSAHDVLEQLQLFGDAVSWKITPETKPRQRWKHRYLPISRLWEGGLMSKRFSDISTESFSQAEEALDRFFQQSMERLWSEYMNGVLSEVRKVQDEGLANILTGVVTEEKAAKTTDKIDSQKAYILAKSFLKRHKAQAALGSIEKFDKRYAQNKQLKQIIGYINQVETRIEQAMEPRNKLQELISKLFSGSKTVRFTDSSIDISTEDESKIDVAALSSGEKHLLRIMIDCLFAEESTIMIDEPEISMHVDWQRELIPTMRAINSESQLILATHSPEVMATVEDEKIFRL